MSTIISRAVRAPEWIWSKLAWFVGCVAFALAGVPEPGMTEVARAAVVCAVFLLGASLGYLLNDLSDLRADRAVGKVRPVADWPRGARVAVPAALLAGIGGLSGAFLGPAATAVVTATVLVGMAYSLRPVRLKERGAWGWIAAALAQRALPAASAFEALDAWDPGAVLLCVHGLAAGIRAILVHQIEDLENDRAAGIRTGAVVLRDAAGAAALARGAVAAEACLTAAAAGALAARCPWVAFATAVVAAVSWGGGNREPGPAADGDRLDRLVRIGFVMPLVAWVVWRIGATPP